VVLCNVKVVINLCLSEINIYFQSMEPLWTKAMRLEACSAYP
jgi:hypothetical protein